MATNFLWQAGTSNSGLLVASFNLMTTELNTLANAAVIISSVGGTAGLFTNSNTAQAVWGRLGLTLGAIGSAVVAPNNVAGWFLESPNSGTTLESTTIVPARPPNFIFILPTTTIAAASFFLSTDIVRVPALQFKVMIQNNTGQTFAASANTVQLATQALQY